MLAIDSSIFIGTTSCFRQRPLRSRMFGEVESNLKITRSRLQGGDDEVGMARWKLESGERLISWKMLGGREMLCGWRRLEGRARLLGWRRLEWRARLLGLSSLVQGDAVKLEEAVDDEVKMLRWRNH